MTLYIPNIDIVNDIMYTNWLNSVHCSKDMKQRETIGVLRISHVFSLQLR